MPKPLSDRDFSNAARRLRCDAAAIRAVAAVESSGAGFLSDGRVKVLFEGHWFHRYTEGRFAERHPDLSYPKWTTAHYARGSDAQARGAGEWERLSRAMKLDRRAALLATSWGRFQIMGFNFAICGRTTIESFVRAMRRSEAAHLDAFCAYLQHNGLDRALREHRWPDFARGYNGAEYRRLRYDARLAAAYLTECARS